MPAPVLGSAVRSCHLAYMIKLPTYREARGAAGRWRRALRVADGVVALVPRMQMQRGTATALSHSLLDHDYAIRVPVGRGLVWIDAEGYEPQAMAGLGPLLERAVPLVIEYARERYTDRWHDELIALSRAPA